MRIRNSAERGVDIQPELHPETSLDAAIAGNLSEREREALDRHFQICPACVAHLALARSSRAILEPLPWDSGLNRRAVDRALASFAGADRRASLWSRRRWAVPLVVALLGLGSAASAAWWNSRHPDEHSSWLLREVAGSVPDRASHRSGSIPQGSALALPVPQSDAERPSLTQRTTRDRPTAAALFGEASAMRDRHQSGQAISIFRRLQQLYPAARETRISFALLGSMLLERGRPAEALAQFDRHLAKGGEASEEALAGRATALQRMGRTADEAQTWRRLLQVFPHTVYAIQAKERLAQIEAPHRSPAAFDGAHPDHGFGHEGSERRR